MKMSVCGVDQLEICHNGDVQKKRKKAIKREVKNCQQKRRIAQCTSLVYRVAEQKVIHNVVLFGISSCIEGNN